MFQTSPNYESPGIFGSLCFAYNSQVKKDKFDPRTRKCLFIGYPSGYKAFNLYDLDTHTIFVSRDVIFFETIFPYKIQPKNLPSVPSRSFPK